MEYKTLVINVDELWLKGRNRPKYYSMIINNIRKVITNTLSNPFTYKKENQRIVVESEFFFPMALFDRVRKIPGVNSIIPSIKLDKDLDVVINEAIQLIKSFHVMPKTFKVVTKRIDKSYPKNSMDISKDVGHFLLEAISALKVDVHSPELTIDLRIYENCIYLSYQKFEGIGGLPIGSSGHLVTLLSGGFDSPVASYLMSKRGCSQTFAFFYAYPFVGESVKDKIIEIAKVLSHYQHGGTLYIIPFGEIQKLISQNCKEDYRTLFFRKYMLECAGLLAKMVEADGLLTGDSLGQVSSQTMGNLVALDKFIEQSIFRPLIGMNKSEIIKLSKEVGTHDISIIPHDDACSLFAPQYPVTVPSMKYLNEYFSSNDFTQELKTIIAKSTKIVF